MRFFPRTIPWIAMSLMRKWMKRHKSMCGREREREKAPATEQKHLCEWLEPHFHPSFFFLSLPLSLFKTTETISQKFRIIICDCLSRYSLCVYVALVSHLYTSHIPLHTLQHTLTHTLSFSLLLSGLSPFRSIRFLCLLLPPCCLLIGCWVGPGCGSLMQSDQKSWSSRAALTSVPQCWLVKVGNLFFFCWISVDWKASQASEA